MRNRTKISVGATIALALAGASIINAAAATGTASENGFMGRRPTSFDVSGEFTGALAGEILLDGVGYQLAPRALLYEIGQGLIPAGTMVTNRRVFLSGRKRRDSKMVYTVIVRPAEDSRVEGNNPSSHVRVRSDSGPQ